MNKSDTENRMAKKDSKELKVTIYTDSVPFFFGS